MIRLPFGVIIGRITEPELRLNLTPSDQIKTRYIASSSPEKAVVPHAVRRTNALSGAPDTRPSGANAIRAVSGRVSKETLDKDTSSLWTSWGKGRKYHSQDGYDLNLHDFQTMDFDELAKLVTELSPEVSKALWDFLLLTNAGFEIRAHAPDNADDVDETAQAAVDAMISAIAEKNGTLGVFFDRLFRTVFMRGAILMELVLAPNGRDFVDIATPDPSTLSFKRVNDPLKGEMWTFGQRQDGKFVELRHPNVKYVPLHPNPDSIEGTPMITSVFFLAVFLMTVLRDTKRVVEHQGYMRLDVEVQFEKLIDTVPDDVRANPELLGSWMRDVVREVESVYSELRPDDTYVHSDSIKINNPVGTVNADSLAAIDALFQVLERMAVRALKTMPLLLATNTNRGETQANREWEIYSKGIETIQHLVEEPIEQLFERALQAQGIQANVKVRFATFRAAEQMRDAQVDLLVAQLARFLYDCGIISQDEMAGRSGYDTADQPEPRVSESASSPSSLQNVLQQNPEPEPENRISPLTAKRVLELLRSPTIPELNEVEEFLKEYATPTVQDLYDADVATPEEIQNLENI